MILDLHTHSKKSEDSRATVVGYLQWLLKKKDLLPIDGLVLTEHRQFDVDSDYRHLEDEYGIRIFKGSEVETDYGHVLVYGVNRDILARFDFANVRLPAQEVISEVWRMGGVALPCHPGRPNVGLCAHYGGKPELEGVVAVEALNGGSKKGEDAHVQELMTTHGYAGFGGSDSHLVSFVGICATEFDRPIRTVKDLVDELRAARCRPVDFRNRPVT